MKYYTAAWPDQNALGEEYTKWETLSEQDILNEYWEYWSEKMRSVGKAELISEERCIEDWCIVNWAVRNFWREMKDNIE